MRPIRGRGPSPKTIVGFVHRSHLQGKNLPIITPTYASIALSNMSDIGPFGTYSFFRTSGYTDTSSLPLGFEQAANSCNPNRRIENGVIESGFVES